MPVKGLHLLAFVAAAMFTSASLAQDQPRSMLGGSFDLKSVILSPTPLGPPSQLEPPPGRELEAAPPEAAPPEAAAKPEAVPTVAQSKSAPRKTVSSKPRQRPAAAARKPKSNPLNAYARDVRRQTWPCTGGGICTWIQPPQ